MLHLNAAVLAVSLLPPGPLHGQLPAIPTRPPAFEYASPVPGAKYVLPETTILLRPGGDLAPPALPADQLLVVTGSRSGRHHGRLDIAGDGQTLRFEPALPFAPGEEVRCELRGGLRTIERGPVPPQEFRFTITAADAAVRRGPGAVTLAPEGFEGPAVDPDPGLPRIVRTVSGPASPGRLFLSDLVFGKPGYRSHLLILDDDGTPVFHRRLPALGADLKLQPDGRLTYFDSAAEAFYALNDSFAIVDSFRCGNGYGTDIHDIQVSPDGHALLLSYDAQPVDMSAVVPGGNPAARVVGLVVQELDREKRVVFQWRSWDHFQITDATHIDLTAAHVDYAHGNAVELDTDGNLMISSRHMDEITKISRRTGRILWRMGGKNNQFSFLNDPLGFRYQHDIRRLPNGNITLFDNGNFRFPEFSRAVEYRLDERRRTATLVWEYRHDSHLMAYAMGSVQRLPSGNTLIGWGSGNPTVTEVTPAGEKVTELAFDPGIVSYRAYRFEWPPVLAARVTLAPRALALRGPAPWVMATIEPRAFDAGDIDVSSVRLAGTVAPDPGFVARERGGDGDHGALRLRFSRSALVPVLVPGVNRVALTGALQSGTAFGGLAELRVLGPANRSATGAPLRLVSACGAAPVRIAWRGADGVGPRGLTLGIYDVRGRLVRRLPVPAGGAPEIVWEARGADGDRVGSGVYWARLEGAESGTALKLVLIR